MAKQGQTHSPDRCAGPEGVNPAIDGTAGCSAAARWRPRCHTPISTVPVAVEATSEGVSRNENEAVAPAVRVPL